MSLEEPRRQKMQRIIELGHDPWGGRFDNRDPIQSVRDRIGEVVLKKEDGDTVPLPDEVGQDGFDFRQWLADCGKGELVGPVVRVAGRIVLQRT